MDVDQPEAWQMQARNSRLWVNPGVKNPICRRPLRLQHRTFGSVLRIQRNEYQTETLTLRAAGCGRGESDLMASLDSLI